MLKKLLTILLLCARRSPARWGRLFPYLRTARQDCAMTTIDMPRKRL